MPAFDLPDPVFRTLTVSGKQYRVLDCSKTTALTVKLEEKTVEEAGDADEPDFLSEEELICTVDRSGEWTRTLAIEEKVFRRVKKELSNLAEFSEQSLNVRISFGGGQAEFRSSSQEDLLFVYSEFSSRAEEFATPTHFVCIPLIDEDVVENFRNFRESVQKANPGMAAALLPGDNKLHLTLCVLNLADATRLAAAATALDDFRDRYYAGRLSEGALVTVPLRKLRTFGADGARVVFSPDVWAAETEKRLLELRALLFTCLASRGLINPSKNDTPTLHVTIFNAKYSRAGQFDGDAALAEFGSAFDLGEAACREVRLCELAVGSAQDRRGKDAFGYSTVSVVDL